MTSAELLLHPVRLRIVQAFLGDRTLTTAQVRELLTDVSTATLYRQVATLVDAGLLEVVEERRVRGATERTYRLRTESAVVGPEEARRLTPDEHRQAFTTFVAGVLDDFDRYLQRPEFDLGRDVVGYRKAALYLTDDEALALVDDLREVVSRRMTLPPEGRTRRLLTTVLLPEE